jgi:predicted Zn finger-like uncharacterized protein
MNIICPQCSATGTISEALVPDGGKVVVCPKCRSKFSVTKVSSKVGPVALSSLLSPDEKTPVKCPECGASGSLPTHRIPAAGTTVTCPKCKARFHAKRSIPSPTAPPATAAAAGENVPFRCPQCGREGSLPGSRVSEGGMGMNCPVCNARFFVRRPGEARPGVTATPPGQPVTTHDGGARPVSTSPGLVGTSVTGVGPLSPTGSSSRGNPVGASAASRGAGSGSALALDDIWSGPSTTRAVAGGAGAAFVGAMIWAFITVMTGYQIGWMAIGVGALVGFAVKFFGRGTDQTFGFIGAGLALFGCVIGNLMAACAFISADPRNPGFISVFLDALGNPGTAARIMGAAFHPLDVLFYIFAVSTGYKVAVSNEQGT